MGKVRLERRWRRACVAVQRLFTRKGLRLILEWLKEPVLVFGAFYLGATAIAQPFYVPSGSMQPTLGIGDLLLATKFSYGYNRYSFPFASGPTPAKTLFASLPEPGDVVVFRKPSDTAQTLVKRVIGLPGDRIQMKAGRLWINGKEVGLRSTGTGKVEDGPGENAPGVYFDAERYIETLPGGREYSIFKKAWGSTWDDTREVVVPEGHVFVLGDNRDDSADSRVDPDHNGVGFLPVANIVGRAKLIVVSVDFVNAAGFWEWPLQFRVARMLKRIR